MNNVTVEFTAFDMGFEVGTFDIEVPANSAAGDLISRVITGTGVALKITAVRRWDPESLELEADVEYC